MAPVGAPGDHRILAGDEVRDPAGRFHDGLCQQAAAARSASHI